MARPQKATRAARAAEAADVTEAPEPTGPKYAEPQAVAEAARLWAPSVLACRDAGHHWETVDAAHFARLRYYRVQHQCARCGVSRYRELSEFGHVYATTYAYPDGYLVPGLGRIVGDSKDAIRLASILRVGSGVRQVRRRAQEDDLPRFGATKHGIEEAE